jgi:hypothetical protein
VYARALRNREGRYPTTSSDREALEHARAAVLAIGEDFRRTAGPALDAALRWRLESLVQARAGWFDAMKPEVQAAFRAAADRAITLAVAEIDRRLADDELWLDPLTAPGLTGATQEPWSSDRPEWFIGIARLLSPRKRGPDLGDLDEPRNRVWVALRSAAKPLDPVLEEFGLPPGEAPGIGGGSYGLAPPSAPQLDSSGTLARLWKRYRAAYARYRMLLPDP